MGSHFVGIGIAASILTPCFRRGEGVSFDLVTSLIYLTWGGLPQRGGRCHPATVFSPFTGIQTLEISLENRTYRPQEFGILATAFCNYPWLCILTRSPFKPQVIRSDGERNGYISNCLQKSNRSRPEPGKENIGRRNRLVGSGCTYMVRL